jgi:hypothetical protein
MENAIGAMVSAIGAMENAIGAMENAIRGRQAPPVTVRAKQ